MNKKQLAVFFLCIFASGILGYFLSYRHYKKNEKLVLGQIKSIRENGDYKFINPLLAYDLPESKELGEYLELREKLSNLVDQQKKQGKADEISIYFRGNQGRWVGINQDSDYYPASLLKVVVMIAYYQQAQSNKEILNKQLKYTADIKNTFRYSNYDSPSLLNLNASYSVEELIRYMIVDSDNGATYTLINSLGEKVLDEVYADFGLQGPSDSQYTISAKNYALFFRVLYNATYLNREYSEKALTLLSETTYKDGLVSGLSEGTVLAHKFGEHVLTDNIGKQIGVELHDCGIIYTEPSFLLCVMSRGKNINDLKSVIKDIAGLVSKEVK
ncbi:MAG: class A beta-lactamase-related serine hydrolase [Candidatus Doudnabacteria bacterium]|nr:class A beta-lactamase-related serine hydrolase [Candidatus Doudnabacteria bacterium]